MKCFAVLLVCLATAAARGQTGGLHAVQRARTEAKQYRQRGVWDSARAAYRHVLASPVYANPYDHLDAAFCSLKAGDGVRFAASLAQALEQGVDTPVVHSYFRQATPAEHDTLEAFLAQRFGPLHARFLQRYDSTAVRELQSIQELDQLIRTPMERILSQNPAAWKTDSALRYLAQVAAYADSINYTRIMRLLESDRFPGYHRCGAAATSLGLALMHFDQPYVQWDRVLARLKQAVQDGDLDPDQVAGIVDRHYLRAAGTPAYYYGRLRWGTDPLFYDCAHVDARRAEIGLESLRAEYERTKRPLPACYGGN